MNMYDFDFNRIEDVLSDLLNIHNPTDIDSLKVQIRDNLNALLNSISKKGEEMVAQQGDTERLHNKIEAQKSKAQKELEEVDAETDLEKVLRKLIDIRCMVLLSLEVKVRQDDSYEERLVKQEKRNKGYALYEMVGKIPSILELMKQRQRILKHIDVQKRIIPFDNTIIKNVDMPTIYPVHKLNIYFKSRPEELQDEYGKVFNDADIHLFKFGTVVYSRFPNEKGVYTQELNRKELVGIVKKNEFSEEKIYTVLMNDLDREVSPKFYRDIAFSDIALRNAKNNQGFLGVPEKDTDDGEYGYQLSFDDIGVEDLLRAIYLEDDENTVLVESNFPGVKSVKGTFAIMKEKMSQTLLKSLQADVKELGAREG